MTDPTPPAAPGDAEAVLPRYLWEDEGPGVVMPLGICRVCGAPDRPGQPHPACVAALKREDR